MNSFIKNKINELKQLCQAYDVKKMYVFGSAGADHFTDDSDIDFLISFKDISIEKYTDNFFALHEKLEALFGRKIDLITENSLSNPYFIEGVEDTKQLVYEE